MRMWVASCSRCASISKKGLEPGVRVIIIIRDIVRKKLKRSSEQDLQFSRFSYKLIAVIHEGNRYLWVTLHKKSKIYIYCINYCDFPFYIKKFGNIRVQSKRSRRLKAYFLRARWFIYNCTTYLSSNWVVNLTNASAVSVQLSSTLKRRYSLQLEWQHRVYSVHSQHRAIQGDNYNVPYYSQLSLW